MMNRFLRLSFCVFLLIILIINNLSAQFKVDRPFVRRHTSGVFIEKIEITDTSTHLRVFCINNDYRQGSLVSTSAPGSNNAFRLMTGKKIYQLQGVEGIPYAPDSEKLGYGDTIFFSLYFDKMPTNTLVFDLAEGASTTESAWMLYGVQMKSPIIQLKRETIFEKEADFVDYFEINRLKLWEIEGFWQMSMYYDENKKILKDQATIYYPTEKVAVLQEHNAFVVYNMKGERLGIYFKHFKKERFTFVFPFPNLYQAQSNFDIKNKFTCSFKLSKKYADTLNLTNTDEKLYLFADWVYLGKK